MSKLVKQVQFGNTGIKISPLIVGCMSYGSKAWAQWVEDDKEKIFQIFKHCYDIGFRTFDTADVYSNGKSERLLGEFLRKFEIRRETVVILTKTYFRVDETLDLPLGEFPHSENDVLDLVNQQGLSRKHILDSVKNSVGRLGTYIDVLQIHRFDPTTPIKETMKALNDVVENGDVRYIGASSMLPTEFVEMQAIADKYDWFQFVNVQSQYNLLYREDERDLMKYCKKHNIALTPWSPNYQGLLTRPVGVESTRSKTDKVIDAWHLKNLDPAQKEIINRVEELSKKKGVAMAAISTAWVMAKGCQPILGMSSIKRVDEAKDALDVKFTEEELAYLEEPYKPREFMI
ncbi:aldo/keto reductase NDAI_0G01600 [Naumovozyma dairenensis CBS 421]|uniref:NADP-dependent oxidoreductase domain-containing protein n=1 Tax=Naumovozyma dairenensis (strain ATCC 10597 / BCRC 20456 / CBS 421 / NBRC 0211 / NRRL Y-12639) TaxID=1071378 RepID=G0WDS5_NAUDC|nr:hypothetical protein NDAI_0G01600 [Naumovozyma dairenensis CBS 421]CCD25936.2 hypothetical protein NDAI_0G01600 [Naumovozyma dairenensis CBS 421]